LVAACIGSVGSEGRVIGKAEMPSSLMMVVEVVLAVLSICMEEAPVVVVKK
jgi:hypothetical protein